jgi:Protein of unknown function (DUF3631)
VQPEPRTIGGLEDVVRFIRRFVVLSDQEADALALWCAHTHALDAAEATPYMTVTSPEKQSGKTRLLEVLELLVREPLMTMNISDAALFRIVNDKQSTLLMDEVDAIFKARDREELRGMLNAGHRRGARAVRMGGANNRTAEWFSVFCPKVFAGIGDCLPDTIVSRSIPVRLQRRLPDEPIARFRRREVAPEGEELRDRLIDWLEPQLHDLAQARPELPEALDDRAQDVWEPLLAIADLAGGDWPIRALRSAARLSGPEARADEEGSKTAILLRDIKIVFENGAGDRIRTSELIEQLSAIEESPWGDWYGKPISVHGLAKLLHPYRIKTLSIWVEGENARGYKREQFEDAWLRVVSGRSGRSGRSDSPSQNEPTAPTTPTTLGSNEALDRILPPPSTNGREQPPFPGDDDFLDYIAAVHRNGHITTAEALEREGVHALILRARGAA